VPLQYFVLMAWAWPLLLGLLIHEAARRPVGRILMPALLATTLILGTAHALGDSREDFRAGVAAARALGKEYDAVYTAILRQPLHYSHGVAYQVYAPDLQDYDPESVPSTGMDWPNCVIVLTRSSGPDDPSSWGHLWRQIEAGRTLIRTVRIDSSVRIFVYKVR
jgi:hypothetical protein